MITTFLRLRSNRKFIKRRTFLEPHLVSMFYKRPVQYCVSNLLQITSNHCCVNEFFYLLFYAVRQVPNYRSHKHCLSRTMATQSDEPTQPTPSANTENFYITEADQFVVNEILTFVSDKINTLPYDMIIKLLGNFYSDDDTASAKNILFQMAFNDRDAPQLIKRKGKDKSQQHTLLFKRCLFTWINCIFIIQSQPVYWSLFYLFFYNFTFI